jgi:hypothetical protein
MAGWLWAIWGAAKGSCSARSSPPHTFFFCSQMRCLTTTMLLRALAHPARTGRTQEPFLGWGSPVSWHEVIATEHHSSPYRISQWPESPQQCSDSDL